LESTTRRGLFSQLDAHTLLTWPVSAKWARGMARISHSLSPASSRNGSRWFAVYDQAEKNRSVKKALLEKKGTLCEQQRPFSVKTQLTDPPLVLGLPLL